MAIQSSPDLLSLAVDHLQNGGDETNADGVLATMANNLGYTISGLGIAAGKIPKNIRTKPSEAQTTLDMTTEVKPIEVPVVPEVKAPKKQNVNRVKLEMTQSAKDSLANQRGMMTAPTMRSFYD